MNDTLFTDQPDPQIDSYLEHLVGEDKKFKTPEDLAKGKYVSDTYIPVLTKRMDELREENERLLKEANERAALTDILDQMRQQQQSNSFNPSATDEKPAINPTDIENIVARKLQETERAKKE